MDSKGGKAMNIKKGVATTLMTNIRKEHLWKEQLFKQFPILKESCSRIVFEKGTLGESISLYSPNPGKIIGRKGVTIGAIKEYLEKLLNKKNIVTNVQQDLLPNISLSYASQLALIIQSDISNMRRECNRALKSIMREGRGRFLGVLIKVTGKVSRAFSRTEYFRIGKNKYSGNYAKEMVQTGFDIAKPPLGIIGVTVKIMVGQKHPDKIIMKVDKDKSVNDKTNEKTDKEKPKQAKEELND